MDTNFYENVETIKNPDDILVLVNKYHALDSNYVPNDLVYISNTSYKMRKEAAINLESLIARASLDNRKLAPFSAYRSYEYQKNLYENYLKKDGLELVDSYSARPGHSEHQTGLACDIKSFGYIDNVSDSDYLWLLNNAYLDGFIIRYLKDKSYITGYKEEPWHLRYVGKEAAKIIKEENITFDEYYDLYVIKR